MAEGKNKIVVYADWLGNFEDLTDEELGKLMRHFFEYVNDLNPVLEDRLLSIAWKPIQATLKRDLKKWETYVEKQKANGKKGGRPKAKKPKPLFENPDEPKKADSVSVSDRDSDIIYNDLSFLESWSKARKHYLNKPTHIKKLDFNEANNFKDLVKDYTPEEIKTGIYGLFKQKNRNISSMYLKPKHFLENFVKYYNAELCKDYELYGKGEKLKTEL